MNKKLTLGIGVCALAFGAVAAVISTRAIETRAEESYLEYVKVHYTADGTWEDGKADIALTKDGDNYVLDKLTLGAGGKFCLYYKWSDSVDTWIHLYETGDMPTGWWPAANNGKREKGDPWNGSSAGDYSITVSDFGWDSSASDAYAKIAVAAAEAVEKEYHLVGLGGDWDATDGNKLVAATETGFAAKIENVELKAGDTFKIKEVTGDKWYGYDSGILISAANLGKIVDDGTSDHNFKVAEGGAGTYSIYYADDGKIGFVGAGETVADLVAPTPLADGYYIVGLGNDWTKGGAEASDELKDGNKFQATGIAMTHGDEFKIVGIKDDAIDWDDKIVVAPSKGEGETDQSANFVTVNDHNNGISLKAIASGTFDVYVNSSSEIYVFGTTEERTAAKEVDEFIDDFITPNVTNPDGEGKYETWESCNDKYTTASTVLERLSAQAKSMFLVDAGVSTKIETARAAYTWWQQHKDVGEGAKYIAPLSAKNTAIIAVSSVVAVGGIIAASMIYFSRKKKQN